MKALLFGFGEQRNNCGCLRSRDKTRSSGLQRVFRQVQVATRSRIASRIDLLAHVVLPWTGQVWPGLTRRARLRHPLETITAGTARSGMLRRLVV